MELLLKINSVDGEKSYKDGDIVQAFSNDRILLANAESICSVDNSDLDPVSGLRYNDTLLMKYMEASSLYKIERINTNSARRTNLLTLEEDIINNSPNSDGEAILVEEFLTRRLRSNRHKVFGSTGSEIWYNGSRPVDLDWLWTEIEGSSDNLKQDNALWKFTELEKRHFLPINACMHDHNHDHTSLPVHEACLSVTCGCDLSECTNSFIAQRNACAFELDGDGNDIPESIAARRKFNVPYWDMASSLSLNVDDIRNMDKSVDARHDLESRPAADLLTVDKVAAGIITL